MNKLFNFARRCCGLNLAVYFLFFLVFINLVGFGRWKAKKLNELLPDFSVFSNFRTGEEIEFSNRQIESFIAYYRKVLDYIPTLEETPGLLGYFYYRDGQTEKAKAMLNRAADIRPDYFWFAYNLGVLYLRESDYDEALKYLMKAVETPPEPTLFYVKEAKLLKDIFSFTDQGHFDPEENLRRGYRDAYRLLITAAYLKRDFADVLKFSTVAIDYSPIESDDFLFFAGLASFELGDYTKSFYFLNECIQRTPRSARVYFLLGKTAAALGQADKAKEFFTSARILGGGEDAEAFPAENAKLRIF